MLNILLLAAASLMPIPATDSCDEKDKAIIRAEEHIVALYAQFTNPTAGCSSKTGTDKDICECLAEGKGAGSGLTACMDLKSGTP